MQFCWSIDNFAKQGLSEHTTGYSKRKNMQSAYTAQWVANQAHKGCDYISTGLVTRLLN